ncbi:hypothetical protein [Roseimaritima ulvae]|nr:hypothetical protein [Roseimaritima ulvae]
MRIPSNFSEQNLYRQRRNLRRQSSHSMRRVIRLVLALGVVLVVMRQAADPGIYKPFFPQAPTALTESPPSAPGTNAPGTTAPGTNAPALNGAETSGPDSPATDNQGQTPDAAAAAAQSRSTEVERGLVARLDADGQKRLTKWLAHWRRVTAATTTDSATSEQEPPPLHPPPGMVERQRGEGVSAGADDLPELAFPDGAAAREALIAACESQVPAFDSPEAAALLAAVDPLTLARLQDALDATYQSRVADGAIWRSSDADAFYRYLELATDDDFAAAFLNAEPPPRRVGVLPLMQQPDEYLGQAVWLYGNVARAVPVPAKENSFGIESYWEVWLRPDDGTERAVILYAPDVPPEVSAVAPDATLTRGPRIAIAGKFLKRRLFGAVGGATESPVIVGRVWQRDQHSPSAPTTSNNRPRFGIILGLAAAVGIGLACVLLWKSSLDAKHLRRVRKTTATLPDSLAQAIAPENINKRADSEPHETKP